MESRGPPRAIQSIEGTTLKQFGCVITLSVQSTLKVSACPSVIMPHQILWQGEFTEKRLYGKVASLQVQSVTQWSRVN